MKTFIRTAGFTIVASVAVIAGIVIGARPTESHDSGPTTPVEASQRQAERPAKALTSSTASSASVAPAIEPRAGRIPQGIPTDTPSETLGSQPPSELPELETTGPEPVSMPPAVEAPPQSPGGEAVPSDPASASAAEVAIIGDAYCRTETSEALALLRDRAPAHYDVVVRHVGIIECAEAGSGMFAWESPPRYQAGMATVQAGAVWYAGTIAHDGCHAKQYQDYALTHPSEQVPQEAFSGAQAEAQCLDAQFDALTQIGAGQDALDTVQAALSTRYWEVDYETMVVRRLVTVRKQGPRRRA